MNWNKIIEKQKNKLITKAKRKGIWENFGQDEVRLLRDKLAIESAKSDDFYFDTRTPSDLIDQFSNWCMNYDINEMAKG